MNINKLRKVSYSYNRKSRRKQLLIKLQEIKCEIKEAARKGKTSICYEGAFKYEYAIAARLFARKNKKFQVNVVVFEPVYLTFRIKRLYFSWGIYQKPGYIEKWIFNEERYEDKKEELIPLNSNTTE